MKETQAYVEFIPVGGYFEIVGLENRFRGLRVKRVTDCAVLVDGYIKNDAGEFVPLGSHSISCRSPVRRIFPNEEKADKKEKKNFKEEPVVKRKRGRPRKNPPK